MRLTARDLVAAIKTLDLNYRYGYVAQHTDTRIKVEEIIEPQGPIWISRYTPGQPPTRASISAEMLARVASAIIEGEPFNLDYVLIGSYNTRSALEALLANTAEFYYCYPGRIEQTEGGPVFKRGHKYLIWLPKDPHAVGELIKHETTKVVTPIPIQAVYDRLEFPDQQGTLIEPTADEREHSLMQIALTLVGIALGNRVYVAKNDQAIIYGDRRIGEIEGVVLNLTAETILTAYAPASSAGRLIDCIWFRGDKHMPAVIEVEHTTGVTSGLARMKAYKDQLPPIETHYVIAAPDEAREEALRKIATPQFSDLKAWFLPYSAIQELYSISQRRNLRDGVSDKFIEGFMERPR